MNIVVDRKITICMLFIALSLLGYVSYKQLSMEMLPNAQLPMIFVRISTSQEVDPGYMESEVVIPVEGAISTIGGIENMATNISRRNATIQVDFKSNTNFNITQLKLQEKLNEVSSSLPDGFTLQMQKVDISQVSTGFMSLQVRGSGGVDRLRNIVDKEIVPELENIDGVASAQAYGGREKSIEIQLDPDKCLALELTPGRISSILGQNTQEKNFVGTVDEYGKIHYVYVDALYTDISELENIVVAPGPILLKDIATIFFDYKEETSYSRINGKEAVSVSLQNDAQANLIDLSHRVLSAIEKINREMVIHDVEVVVQTNNAELMEDNIGNIINMAILGAILAIIILWFFLRNIRLVVSIALSIPVSVFVAFNLFYAYDITLNSLTLVGMALAVGMLLDNSIVVLENIYRLSAAGAPPRKAVTQGVSEVWRSIVAATLTTITVFLPFIFAENYLIKLLGKNIGISIVSTLSVSLFVAFLLIPMLTYLILKGKNNRSIFYETVSITQRPIQIYLVVLKTCLRNPGITIFGSIILLFVSLILSLTLNVQKMSEVETNQITVSVTMFTGSTLESTDQAVRNMEDRLENIPEIKDLYSNVNENGATLNLLLKDKYYKIRDKGMAELKSEVTRLLSGIDRTEIQVSEGTSQNSSSGSGMENFMRLLGIGDNREKIVIRGSDYDMMQLVGEEIQYYLSEQEYISSSRASFNRRQPEIRLDLNQILQTTYEISRNDISSGLNSLSAEQTSGSTFKIGDETYDIIIRNYIPEEKEEEEKDPSANRVSVDDLRKAKVESSAAGGIYELENIADIRYSRGMSQIRRVNQDKQLEVTYSFSSDIQESKELLKTYRSEVEELIAAYNLPSGVALEIVHEEEDYFGFQFLILAAFILIFMILASVFESVTTPLVLLFTIPLSAIGALLALLLTGNSLLNANTLTGFLILLGIVVNNGIILIDYANILRSRGFGRNRAIMTSGLSRIRPILITSMTTIVAMLPLALGKEEYAGAIGAPFAITVIGGLAFSSLLTLIVIPTVYIGLENTLSWYRTLPLKLKLFHLALLIIGLLLINRMVYDLLWQIIFTVALVILIPGMTRFAQTSLKRADKNVVDPDKPISIEIRNLVKIYDWFSLFQLEWESGLNIRKRLKISTDYHRLKDFLINSWQYILFGALVYFTWFYLEKAFWIYIFSFAIYFWGWSLWTNVMKYLIYRFPKKRIFPLINRCFFWLLPAFILSQMYLCMGNRNLIVVTSLVWAFCLVVFVTSGYLYRNNINIERVTGRFAGFRRSFFRMVKSIPIIGKRKKPFKALRGVSMNIGTGMFGLLGPNGAGKSTLMRILCGILNQSYGSIWINGLDTRIYREELQGLIGFLPQEFGTYENMTSWDFLDYQAILKGITDKDTRKERLEYVLKAVHMWERREHKIGSFSGGMKQRIGIALILLHLPRILIVDEPTAGLDPRERIRFRNLLVELSRDRIVIFSTHIIEDISSSCNQVAVINKGELRYYGVPGEMVGMAQGKIWQFRLDYETFERELDKSMIVHHMEEEGIVQVRYLSETKPREDAIQVEPNLEDAYLCLLKNI